MKALVQKISKKTVIIAIIVALLIVTATTLLLTLGRKETNSFINVVEEAELAVSREYDQFEDGDELIDGTDNVKFSAFFLRDLDGDGYAEKIKGSCQEIGENDILYMELIVQTEGHLKDAAIHINGQNFCLRTALPKDSELLANYIGNDVKEIQFEDLNNGVQKLLIGQIMSGNSSYNKTSAINNNYYNYSREDNEIILTGTYVDGEGNEIDIYKPINLTVDWHGTATAAIVTHSQTYPDIEDRTDGTGSFKANFNVSVYETEKELLIKSNVTEVKIPELNGYAPESVRVLNGNANTYYDPSTGILRISKEATTYYGEITESVGSDLSYGVEVIYPEGAYDPVENLELSLDIPISTYFYGYNNSNEEFENPYKSNTASGTIKVNYLPKPVATTGLYVTIGKYVVNGRDGSSYYMVSKRKPINIYQGISSHEENDNYNVSWNLVTGSTEIGETVVLKENNVDKFIKADLTSEEMNNITSYVGVYASGLAEGLNDDGELRVYDDDTNNLLITLTKNNYSNYYAEKPYKYDLPVRKVRVEIDGVKSGKTIMVGHIKQLDDDVITSRYDKENFDNLINIRTELVGFIGENTLSSAAAIARYEEPYSSVSMNINKKVISTQSTEKNVIFTITPNIDFSINKDQWLNGSFLLKIPESILDVKINSVTTNNSKVSIDGYNIENHPEGKFLRITTSNLEPETYSISVNTDITPDPRLSSTTVEIQLYAANELGVQYDNEVTDIYDVNNNLNTEELVTSDSSSIEVVAPNSLLTNESASDYDDSGIVILSPQIADLKPVFSNEDREKATVKIGVQLKNNYNGTVSEALILGKIPFEGNTYVISNTDLGSEFTAEMTNAGIEVPDELEGLVTIYYSEKENPTQYLSDGSNGWKTKENVSDWSQIKTFLIDFNDVIIQRGKEYTFYYVVRIPYDVQYNKVSYSHHGIFFSLDTPNGKYKTKTEPNKIGIRIADKYNIKIIKTRKNRDTLVSKAIYKVSKLQANGTISDSTTSVTDANGMLEITNLYVGERYRIQEIKSPSNYALNEDVIDFIGHIDAETKNLYIEKIAGTVKGDILIEKNDNEEYKATFNVEDEINAILKICKVEEGTNNPISNVRFRVTGTGLSSTGKFITTNRNGEVTLSNIRVGGQYTIEEIKATGYYLSEPVSFSITNTEGVYDIKVLDGVVKEQRMEEQNDVPVGVLTIEDEKIPTCSIEINKVSKDDNSQPLSGASFKLYSENKEIDTFTTDEFGKILIENLYQYDSERNANAIYVLKEVDAPTGYTITKDITFYVEKDGDTIRFVSSQLSDYTVEGDLVKITIEDEPIFKMTKTDADTGALLPNTKFVIYNIDQGEVPATNSKGEILGTKEVINGKEYYTLTTDSNGVISADLKPGLYKAKEVLADDKYDISDQEQYFGIGESTEPTYLNYCDFVSTITHTGSSYVTSAIQKVLPLETGGYVAYATAYNCNSVSINKETTIDFNSGWGNHYLVVFDERGKYVSHKILFEGLEGNISNMIQTMDGGFLITVDFYDSQIILENGTTYTNGDSGYSSDTLLVKYNPDFNIEWVKQITSNNNNFASNILETLNGDIIIIGDSYSYELMTDEESINGDSSGYVISYDSDGNYKWGHRFGYELAATIEKPDGSLLVFGSIYDDYELQSIIPFDTYGQSDGIIVEINSSGTIVGVKAIGGDSSDNITNAKIVSNGDYIIYGTFNSDEIYYNGNAISREDTSNNGILIKFDELGNYLWKIEATVSGFDVTENGGIYAYDNDKHKITEYDADGNVVSEKDTSSSMSVLHYSKIQNGKYFMYGNFDQSMDYMHSGASGGYDDNGFFLVESEREIPKAKKLWTDSMATKTNDSLATAIKTSEGNYLVADTNGYIRKYDSNGNNLWEKQYGNDIRCIYEKEDGNYFIVGSFKTDIDLGNGQTLVNRYPSSGYSYWTTYYTSGMIIELDKNGNAVWGTTVYSRESEYVTSITETDDGGFVFVGYTYADEFWLGNGLRLEGDTREYGYASFMVKYNASKQVEWVRTFKDNWLSKIFETSEGDLLVSGDQSNVVYDYGNDVIVEKMVENDLANSPMVVKFDSSGTAIWGKSLCSRYDGSIDEIKELSDGNYIIIGSFSGRQDLGNNIVLDSSSDATIIKMDKDGNILLAKRLGSYSDYNYYYNVNETLDGGLLIGACLEYDYLGNGVLIGDERYYRAQGILKLDADFVPQWFFPIVTKSYSDNKTYVFEGNPGTYFVVGSTKNDYLTIGDEEVPFNHGSSNESALFITLVSEEYGVEEQSELFFRNPIKEFKITTEVEKVNGFKGGSISGDGAFTYEKVKYDETSVKEIKMIPDSGYEIMSITINGVEQEFEPLPDGSYILPQFENLKEDKHIVVKYLLGENKFTIKKVDSVTNEGIPGVTFDIEQIEERPNVDQNEIIGDIVDDGVDTTYKWINNEISGAIGTLLSSSGYRFVETDNGDGTFSYVPNNTGRNNTNAWGCIPIDLTNFDGEYMLVINSEIDTDNDIGQVFVNTSTENPTSIYSTPGRWIYNSGKSDAKDYYSFILTGGNKYYLHMGYAKDATSNTGNDIFKINSIKLYDVAEITNHFTFIKTDDNKYIPNNRGHDSTVATGYIPIDLTDYAGKYILTINTEVSTYRDDTGFIAITNSTDRVDYDETKEYFYARTATRQASDNTIELIGGEMYYIHLGYTKDGSRNYYDKDDFIINSISISLSGSELHNDTIITNENGEGTVQIPYGKYRITETSTPNDYYPISDPIEIEFRDDGNTEHEYTINNEKKAKLVVHHYLKGTTTSVADDETIYGHVGDNYSTSPLAGLDGYELEKDIDGNYIVPDNRNGLLTYEDQEVIYYYEKTKLPLIIHHYIEGTNTPVPLANGNNAEDETRMGDENEEYTTSPIQADLLDENYELLEIPSNANGTYQEPYVEVTYYYRRITKDFIIKKIDARTNEPLEGAKIDLYNTSYNTIGTFVTNGNGEALVTVGLGTYYIREYQAPTGYQLDYSYKRIVIDKNTNDFVYVFENQPKKGEVRVYHYIERLNGTKTSLRVPLTDGTTAAMETKNDYIGELYVTEPKTNVTPRYKLSEVPANAYGEYTNGTIYVYYYYKEQQGKVTVHHYLEGTTTQIADDVILTGLIEDSYSSSEATHDSKYELVATPSNATGTYTEADQEVTYYYRLKDTSVLVHHYIEGTTDKVPAAGGGVVEDVLINGKVDDEYQTVEAANKVAYYELVSEPTNKNGTMTEDQIEVIYYYRIKSYPYTVNYLERGSNGVLHEAKQGDAQVWGTTISSTDEIISIDGYVYVQSNPAELTITENENVLNLYYAKLDNLSYTVNYLEKDTNKVLHTPKDGTAAFNDVINAVDEEIAIDGYNHDSNNPESITIGIDATQNVLNIYYTKRTDLSYTVNYLEKDTNRVIHTQKTAQATFEQEINAADEEIAIEGYKHDSNNPTSITVGTDASQNVINIYYTKRTDLSYTVNYLEKGTNNVLHTQKTAPATFEQVINAVDEEIAIDGYAHDSNNPESITIKVDASQNVLNIYYTKRTDLHYTVNYLEKGSNKVLHTPKTSEATFEQEINASNEVIAIDGYNYDSSDPASIVIGTDESQNVINIYYTKKTDIHYTVNYLEKDSNRVLHTAKTAEATFEQVINAVDEEIPIDGYTHDSNSPESITIKTDESQNVLNIYYIKRTDLSYTVHYYEEGTTTKVAEDKVVTGQTFGNTITENAINVSGYNKVDPTSKDVTITTGTNEIAFYYAKKTDLSYVVHYKEQGSERTLHEDKSVGNQTFGSKVTEDAIDINGYNKVTPTSVEITIQDGVNEHTFYYTKRTDLSYTVNYLEKDSNRVLHEPKVQGNMTFEQVVNSSSEVIDINGYNFAEADKNALTIGTGENVINLYYMKKTDLSYTVNYLEKGSNRVLHEPKVQGDMTFEQVVNSSDEVIGISGYNFSEADKVTLTIGTGENVINLYYTKKTDLSYTIHYKEQGSNRTLHEDKVVGNQTFGTKVTENAVDINGYNKVNPITTEITIQDGVNEYTFYYAKRTDLNYKVNYLEKDSDRVLKDQKVQNGMTFEQVINSADEVVPIDGFNFVEADKETLTIGTGENIINLYYTKRTDLSYTVNYLEKGSNKVLHEPKVQGNMTFEQVVNSSDEIISINGYNFTEADKETLSIGTGENIINLYYTKRADLSYTVNYLEQGSNAVLHEPKVQGNMTFEQVVNSSDEVIGVDGYNFAEADKATLTIGTGENVINLYYTKRTDLGYTVYYKENGTNNTLANPKVVTGQTFGSKATENAININGYTKVEPTTAEINITTGTNEHTFYYEKRTDLSYVVYYKEYGSETELRDSKTVTNKTYLEEVQSISEYVDIPGYNYKEVDPASLTISYDLAQNVITIYYTKKTDLSYTVYYREQGTNINVATPKVVEGQTLGNIVTENAINVSGYNKVGATSQNITITAGNNEAIFYYAKKTDLSYTIHYKEKDTERTLATDKVVGNQTFGVRVTENAIDIDGYNKINPTTTNLTINDGVNEYTFYYTKRTDLGYIVHYKEEESNATLAPDKTVNGKTFEEKVEESAIDINGYNKVDPTNVEITITTGANEHTFFYTKRTDLSYTVNYLEKDSNKVLHEQKVQGNMTFEQVVNSSDEILDINGYNFREADKETLTIGTGENVINLYYTKKSDLSYTVNYLEKDSNAVLHEPKVQGNMIFETEISSSDEVIPIDGYNFVEADKNALTIGTSENVINLYYAKRTDLGYTIYYKEEGTDATLVEAKEVNGKTFGEKVTESAVDVNGYNKVSPTDVELTMTTGTNEHTFYYTKRTDLSYTVNYLEKDSNAVVHEQKVQGNMTFEQVVNSSDEVIDINGYNFAEADKNSLTIGTGENVINLYYTKKTDLGYTIYYKEQGTDATLLDPKAVPNQTFGEKIVESAIDINGYNKVDPTEVEIEITTGVNEHTFYYTKRTDLSYTVNYLEKDSNKVLHEPKVQGNMTFEQVVNSSDEVIDINGYNFAEADKNTLTIGTGENVINLYYTKKSDLSYTVNYLEQGSNAVVHEPKVQGDMTFEQIIRSRDEVLAIDGYNFVEADKETLTIGTGENVINLYYAKRTDLSYIVHYYEDGTTNKVAEDKQVDNQTFGIRVTETAVDVTGFNKLNPTEKSIDITTGVNEIIFYYGRKTNLSYTVHYKEQGTETPLAEDKVALDQSFGSVITENAIDINGYNLVGDASQNIRINDGTNEITFYYTKRTDLSYKVHYKEQGTERELAPDKTIDNQTFGDKVHEEAIDIDGYNKVDPVEVDIEITTGTNEHTFYYTKRTDLSYTVHYKEQGSERELAPDKTIDNQTFGDSIHEEAIDIDGYNKLDPVEASIDITTGVNEHTFYYEKKNDLSYTVHYREQGTELEVAPDKKISDQTFGETVHEEAIDIDGYNKVDPNEVDINITTGANEHTFYYTKRTDLGYTVRYRENGTDKELAPDKIVGNQTFGDKIHEEALDIDGYNKIDPVEVDIDITTGVNEHTFLYEKRNDLEYKVRYVDKTTNEEIDDPKVVKEVTFETEVKAEDEIRTFYKYNFVEYDKEKIIVGTNPDDNVITLYYIKKDASVVVHYYEEGTTNSLSPDKLIEGKVDDPYETTEADDIPIIYELVEEPYNKEGNMTVDQIEVIYNYKLKGFAYTINYLDIETGDSIHDPKQGSAVNGTIINSNDEIISIEKYDYNSVDKDTLEIGPDEAQNIINIYYSKKISKVTAHYYIEGTEQRLSDDVVIQDKVDTEYHTFPADDINNDYELVEEPTNKDGYITVEPIEVIYNYRLKDTQVIVNYIDQITNETIADEIVIDGKVRDHYETEQKDIENYTFVEDTQNTIGEMTVDTIYVNYYYKHNAKVIVNYIYRDEDGNEETLKTKEENGLEGDTITVMPENFEGYVLVERPDNETITMTVEPIVVNYYYVKVSQGLLEKHVDDVTDEVLYEELHTGKEGDPYQILPKEFDRYELNEDKLPDNSEGTMKEELIEVVYYYSYIAKVTINYVDIETGEDLVDPIVKEGHIGDEYDSEEKEIEKYEFVEVEGEPEGTLGKDDIVVNYYYRRLPTKVIENHIDETTDEILYNEETVLEEGDPYETEPKNFDNYDIVTEKLPTNGSGEMGDEDIVINYYYIRKAMVNVEYIDFYTGRDVTRPIEYKGHVGDNYSSQEQTVPGYKLVTEQYPENSKGTMTKDPITVTYFYVKEAKVTERHIYKNKVLDEETHNGLEGDPYVINPKTYENYILDDDNLPTNSRGYMEEDEIIVTYRYVDKAIVDEKHIDEDSKIILAFERHEGKIGDKYDISSRNFEGYELSYTSTENNRGEMTKEPIEVLFWYKKVEKPVEPTPTPEPQKQGPITVIIRGDGETTAPKQTTVVPSQSTQIPSLIKNVTPSQTTQDVVEYEKVRNVPDTDSETNKVIHFIANIIELIGISIIVSIKVIDGRKRKK